MSVLEGACNANLISLRVHETGNASKQQYAAFYDLLTSRISVIKMLSCVRLTWGSAAGRISLVVGWDGFWSFICFAGFREQNGEMWRRGDGLIKSPGDKEFGTIGAKELFTVKKHGK
ncbi:hypothetical protein Zmor_023144 [Zophobas morio]|uniref:Uncharacterized protein n=1 Tax=Zophobas morio TaxID=2755281 RepID=A0AA38I2N4_9CUCU|nr:hypothetical protein Zmor_023144 [Zophobas morio]